MDFGTGRTGGREATTGVIPGRLALSVGYPDIEPPRDWRWTLLGSVAQLESGHTPSRRHPAYWKGDIPWIGIKDASENHGRTLLNTYQHVSEIGLANSSARLLPAKTVCLSRTASVGFVVVMGRPMATSQDFVNWVCGPNIEPHYLKYVLLAESEALWRFASGTTHQTIYYPEAKAFHVCLPPLAVQKAIVSVLGALDDKIELYRQMNVTLEETMRALFQSWFVDFDPFRARLDGYASAALEPGVADQFAAGFEESSNGQIPSGWTVGKLGDIGSNAMRGVQPSDIAFQTPYIGLEHMPRRSIALADWSVVANVTSGKSAFKLGEILFGKLRPYFHKVGVAPIDGVCSTDILVLVPKTPDWFGFLLGHLISDELIQFTDLSSTGTKMPRTNWRDISSYVVALPPKPIAAAFTRTIKPMIDCIHANLHQSHALSALRDTLLPKLISGQLTVSDGTFAEDSRV